MSCGRTWPHVDDGTHGQATSCRGRGQQAGWSVVAVPVQAAAALATKQGPGAGAGVLVGRLDDSRRGGSAATAAPSRACPPERPSMHSLLGLVNLWATRCSAQAMKSVNVFFFCGNHRLMNNMTS